MKKTDFVNSIKQTIMEFYPGEYRITMEDINNNVAPSEKTSMLPRQTKTDVATSSNSFMYPKDDTHELDKNIHEVFQQFKAILKEDINEVDFSTRIRGVMYEYADGVAEGTEVNANPTQNAVDPTVDPTKNPAAVKQKGQDMKTLGQKVEDLGKDAEAIKNKPLPVAEEELKEYVTANILPTVVEIIKRAERPRSTKKELMEMFKLSK